MAGRREQVISCPSEVVSKTNGDLQSYCCPSKFNPCLWWSSFCSWYVHLLERFFGCFGKGIAKHPLITIAACLMVVSICSVGFVWFHSENRTVKLFIPQSSQAIDDLDRAEKYFRVKNREEIILLVASSDHPNVLAPGCLRQAFKVHHTVMELESYSDFCVTLSGDKAKSLEDCMMINPLEFLQFNESDLNNKNLTQIREEIIRAYKNTSMLTRNGRPYWYNFNRMFGDTSQEDGKITDAKALQMVYLMRDPSDEDENKKVLDWEKTFIDKVSSLVDTLSCFEVHYSSERSLDDAIAESSGSDITLVSITFSLMITFACVMLGKFLNPLTGHSLLANAGVFAVALGILAGFGLAMWCRVPFVSIVGVLPFLVLGIGIDDMFIMVDELDRQPREMTRTDIIRAVMAHSGATVTMTTMTDLVAFAVSTSTSFPAIRYFCIYAALTVTLSFFMIITYFVAIMTYDVKRIKSGRRDCSPFCLAPPPKEGAPAWDEPLPQMSNRVMEAWGEFLTFPLTKVVVIVFSLGLLATGIYGVTQVDETFDRRILAKDDSYLKRFLSAEEKHFELSIEVSVVLVGEVDYGANTIQEELKKLTSIITDNAHYRNRSLSWMNAFSHFGKITNMNTTHSAFLPALKTFLNVPNFRYFAQDLKFSKDSKKLEASRIVGFMKSSGSSTFQKNAMLTLRKDIMDNSELNAFPIARPFIFFEQYVITSRETIRNLVIAALAVLVVTSPFLVDCTVAFLVVLNFAALICELFALMVIWDVSLNSVSMINLVMAIGFAVDYSAHIAHAYVVSNKVTANERVVDALRTLGASVFMGGFSTFLGMVVLAFAASEIFRIFFRMFLGIVVFGLLHGLCILPVYLSLLCWRPTVIRPSSLRVCAEEPCNREQEDENSEGLQLAHIGSVDSSYPVDNPSSQSSEPGDPIKEDNTHTDGKATQKGEGTTETMHCVVNAAVEIGIENKGMEVNEKEVGSSSTGEDSKQQCLSKKPDLAEDSMESDTEYASTSENPTIHSADIRLEPDNTAANEKRESSSDDASINQNAEQPSTLVSMAANKSDDFSHAPYDTDAHGNNEVTQASEGTVANKNEEQQPTQNSGKDVAVSTFQ